MYKMIHLGLIKFINLKKLFNFFENIFFYFTLIAAYPSGTGVGIQ